jgi:hypothetical protein
MSPYNSPVPKQYEPSYLTAVTKVTTETESISKMDLVTNTVQETRNINHEKMIKNAIRLNYVIFVFSNCKNWSPQDPESFEGRVTKFLSQDFQAGQVELQVKSN